VYTCDGGEWPKREWKTSPAKVDEAERKISADLPAGVKVFYINAITDTGLTVSTEQAQKMACSDLK
jgi:hypothetical protein